MTRLQSKVAELQARVDEFTACAEQCSCGAMAKVEGIKVSEKGKELVSTYAQTLVMGLEVVASNKVMEQASSECQQVRSECPQVTSDCQVMESGQTQNRGTRPARKVVDGSWSFKGGSKFWRPSKVGQDTCKDRKDDGAWVREGNSRIWRKEGVTSPDDQGWTKVVRGPSSRTDTRVEQVKVSNRFSMLEREDPDNYKEKVQELVIGDSRVRPLRHNYCGPNDRCTTIPGAKIRDVEVALKEELGRVVPDRIVVQVGVNNIGPRCSVALRKEYYSLLQRLRETRKPVLVTGVLPRLGESTEWYSRAMSLNQYVRRQCKSMGLGYVDLWDEFMDNRRFFRWDGLHLSDIGAQRLGGAYRTFFQGN